MKKKSGESVLKNALSMDGITRYTILSLTILALLPATLFAESIRVGYFIVAPFTFIEESNNELKGAVVEFLEKIIAPEMGVKVIWAKEAASIPRLLFQIKNHELDACSGFAKNPERAKILNFPRNPTVEATSGLALIKNHPLQDVTKVEDILGLKIGYVHKAYLSPFMRDSRIRFEFVSQKNAIFINLQKLLAGRIDAQYQPNVTPLLYYARQVNVEDKIKIVYLPEKMRIYTAFSKKSGKDLAERYDRAFEKMGGRRAFKAILSTYVNIDRH